MQSLRKGPESKHLWLYGPHTVLVTAAQPNHQSRQAALSNPNEDMVTFQ